MRMAVSTALWMTNCLHISLSGLFFLSVKVSA